MREEEFSAYRPLLFALARRFDPALREDCVQAGFLGLMEAARRYDASKGVQFVTYAVPWVLGEMRRTMVRENDGTGACRQLQSIRRQERALFQRLGREPRLNELAQECGLEPMEIVRMTEAAQRPKTLDGEEGEAPLLSFRLCGEAGISLEKVDVRLALEQLDEEARRLIVLRFYRDRTQKEAALLLGKSQAQVSRMERRALDQLKKRLS